MPATLPELGARYGAPAVSGWLAWLAGQARTDEIDLLLFLPEQGYALRLLAGAPSAPDLPRCAELPGSRVAFMLAGIEEAEFATRLDDLLAESDGLAPFEVLERIGVPAPADHVMEDIGLGPATVLAPVTRSIMRSFLWAYRAEILKVCRRTMQGLFQTLIACGVEPGMRVGLVGTDWDGRTQAALHVALAAQLPVDLVGYYLALDRTDAVRERRDRMVLREPLSDADLPPAQWKAFAAGRIAADFILTPPQHTVIGYARTAGGVIVPVQDGGRGDIEDRPRIGQELLAGIMQGKQPISDPSAAILSLLAFSAGDVWRSLPPEIRPRSLDPWTSTRNRPVLAQEAEALSAG